MGPVKVADELEKIADTVKPHPITGCWLWQGELNAGGYARMRIGGRKWLVHRFLFVLFYGAQRNNWELDHICNRPDCVRPNHVYSVTRKQNEKNRAWRDARDGFQFWKQDYLADMPPVPLLLWAGSHGLPVAPYSWRVEQR
ncbi:HNH endonuclease [Arthrobacter stackebrandtii]